MFILIRPIRSIHTSYAVIMRYSRTRHVFTRAMLDYVFAKVNHVPYAIAKAIFDREHRKRILKPASRRTRAFQSRVTPKSEITIAKIRNTIARAPHTHTTQPITKLRYEYTATQYILVLHILAVSITNYVALTRCITDLTFCK
jgi:hypothetical protein